MACGENPKRVCGSRKSAPSTRTGNIVAYGEAWICAQRYIDSRADYEASEKEDKNRPVRDLELETLAGALKGDIIVHMYCYRAAMEEPDLTFPPHGSQGDFQCHSNRVPHARSGRRHRRLSLSSASPS
jgi:hypothetical protein